MRGELTFSNIHSSVDGCVNGDDFPPPSNTLLPFAVDPTAAWHPLVHSPHLCLFQVPIDGLTQGTASRAQLFCSQHSRHPSRWPSCPFTAGSCTEDGGTAGVHRACVLVLASPVLWRFRCEFLLPFLVGRCAHSKFGPTNLITCSFAFGAQWLSLRNGSSLPK